MPDSRLLADIAHARAGDKGDDSFIVVIPFEEHAFGTLCEILSPERVSVHFGVYSDNVRIHAIHQLSGVIVEVRSCLGGGVTRSGRADPHGKTLSGHLLGLPIAPN